MESKEIKGIWYLPGKEDKKVSGILYLKKREKIKLELIGSLIPGLLPFLGETGEKVNQPEIIYGESADGKNVTLLYCSKGASSYNFSSSFPLTSYICQYVVEGKHLTGTDEKCFNKIEVLSPDLSQWMAQSVVNQTINFKDENEPESFVIRLNNKPVIHCNIEISPKHTLSLTTFGSFSGDQFYPDTLKISQQTYFKIESASEKSSLFELLELANLFNQFLSLATGKEQVPMKIYLHDFDDFQQTEHSRRYNEIALIQEDKENVQKSNRTDFLFSFKDIEPDFENIIQKWYSSAKDLAPIRHHLIESIKSQKVFTSLDFLIVVQALEGYHTRFIEPNSEVSYKKNGPSLKERIESLITAFSSDVQKIAKLDLNLQLVVNTSDYYSHFFESDKKPLIKEGIELFKTTEKLTVLLICCVLDLIGFSKQSINDIINKRN